jgi:hypothetical protein
MKRERLFQIGLALVTTTSLVLSSGALSSSAAAKPKVTVSPSTNLRTGQTIKVSGTGFKAGDQVYVVECLASAKGGSQCNTLGVVPATISTSGRLPTTSFKVLTGKIGTGLCGTTVANAKKCDISVGNVSGGDSATAPIAFKVK